MIARLPHFAPSPRRPGPDRWVALRDVPYLAVTAVNGLLSLPASILLVVLPLWIDAHTGAPRWVVAAPPLSAAVGQLAEDVLQQFGVRRAAVPRINPCGRGY